MKTILMPAILMALLSACVATGPRTSEIVGNSNADVVKRDVSLPYTVIAVDRGIAAKATDHKRNAKRETFIKDNGASRIVLGVGDQLQVTIVSVNDTGFLDIANSALAPISSTALPPQQVGPDGMINIPPIGRMRAAGSTVQGFEALLTRRLGELLVQPTAVVQLVDRQSAQVTLVGSISSPGTYSINQNSRHLVQVIAQAGGAAGGKAENMQVIMTRKGHTGKAALSDIYEKPNLNVHLRDGDVIRFEPYDGQFTVLGAGGVNANLKFSEIETTLVTALGQSGGILRNRADPRGVFIYRLVSRDAAIGLGVDPTTIVGNEAPVIFKFDMKQPQALFIAKEFEIADGDILYVSTTLISEINAAISAFGNFIPTPREAVSASN